MAYMFLDFLLNPAHAELIIWIITFCALVGFIGSCVKDWKLYKLEKEGKIRWVEGSGPGFLGGGGGHYEPTLLGALSELDEPLKISITVETVDKNNTKDSKPRKYHEPVFDDMTCREPSYDGGYGHEPDFNIDSFDDVNDTEEINYVDPEPSYDSNDGHEPSYD